MKEADCIGSLRLPARPANSLTDILKVLRRILERRVSGIMSICSEECMKYRLGRVSAKGCLHKGAYALSCRKMGCNSCATAKQLTVTNGEIHEIFARQHNDAESFTSLDKLRNFALSCCAENEDQAADADLCYNSDRDLDLASCDNEVCSPLTTISSVSSECRNACLHNGNEDDEDYTKKELYIPLFSKREGQGKTSKQLAQSVIMNHKEQESAETDKLMQTISAHKTSSGCLRAKAAGSKRSDWVSGTVEGKAAAKIVNTSCIESTDMQQLSTEMDRTFAQLPFEEKASQNTRKSSNLRGGDSKGFLTSVHPVETKKVSISIRISPKSDFSKKQQKVLFEKIRSDLEAEKAVDLTDVSHELHNLNVLTAKQLAEFQNFAGTSKQTILLAVAERIDLGETNVDHFLKALAKCYPILADKIQQKLFSFIATHNLEKGHRAKNFSSSTGKAIHSDTEGMKTAEKEKMTNQ